MIRRFCIIPFLVLVLLFAGTPAHAETATVLNVSLDHGVPVALSAPAASVFIANPDVADIQVMSPKSVMVFGKKTGETTLLATDSAGQNILFRTVVVSQDLTDLRRELKSAIPGNKITVEGLPDAIVLTGETHDPIAVEDARKIAARYITKDGSIINRIQVVGSNQIMLRVRFAEMSRTLDKSFGIDWGSLTSIGGFMFGLASGAPLTALGNISSSLPTLNGESTNNATPSNALGFTHAGGRWNVNGLIDALAQDGLVTILAEPNLTAMSGETANFLAGGQVPVPIPQSNGTISIQYMPYGISLEFTPTLVGENRINLHVKPEVSQLSSVGQITVSNLTAPAFTTRKTETTVELGSGQSFAIAGLLDNNQDQTIKKFPFLGDVPILGPLFRSTDFQNDQTELVIVVTPYVVKPGQNTQAMALPMDGYSPPSDSERLIGLRNGSADPNARPMSGPPLAVPVTPPTLQPNDAVVPGPSSSNLNQKPQARDTAQNDIQEVAPEPAAAPVAPVSTDPITPALNNIAPASINPDPSSSPGGFILE